MFFVTVMVVLAVADAAKILGVFTVPSYSHQIVFEPIWMELARRGHEMVIITPKVIDTNMTNLKQIDIGDMKVEFKKEFNFSSIIPESGFKNFANHMLGVVRIEDVILRKDEVQEVIKNEKFDLVIVQWLTHSLLPLGAYFNAPIVGVSSLTPYYPIYQSMGVNPHPVSHPDFLTTLPSTNNLNLFERIQATTFSIFAHLFHNFWMIPKIDSNTAKNISPNLPSVSTLQHNISALFVQNHPLYTTPRPNLPNVIEFSGLHLQKPKPLPEDLKKFLDNATEGVVYVSLGTNVKSSLLPPSLNHALVRAFSSVPYKILWKFEETPPKGLGSNVFISKWLPQQDVLRHPNVKAFFTQGGAQSLDEAVNSKIPIIGLPIFSDQPRNIHQAVLSGVGLSVNPQTVTSSQLRQTIIEVVENPKYRQAIEKISKITSDRQVDHLDNIIWWIEYVIRHKGAGHLRGPYPEISWWKFYFLDQILFIAVLFVMTWKLLKMFTLKLSKEYEQIYNELRSRIKTKLS